MRRNAYLRVMSNDPPRRRCREEVNPGRRFGVARVREHLRCPAARPRRSGGQLVLRLRAGQDGGRRAPRRERPAVDHPAPERSDPRRADRSGGVRRRRRGRSGVTGQRRAGHRRRRRRARLDVRTDPRLQRRRPPHLRSVAARWSNWRKGVCLDAAQVRKNLIDLGAHSIL